MFSTIQQQSLSEQKGIIRQTGLRATSSRIAVLDYLRRVERPVSHADVVAAFTDLPWDKTTIYRNLNDFVRVGLARKTELGDRVWRFEFSATDHSAKDHPHFVCTECGNVLCLLDVEVSMIPSGPSPQAIRDAQVEFQIRGCCDDCR